MSEDTEKIKSWNRFECSVGDVGHPQHTQTGSNFFHDSGR
jgi:hypothetical protein